MDDDYKQLYENQVIINEQLRSRIIELNEMIQDQLCIPNCKPTICDACDFRKRQMADHGGANNVV